MGDHTRARQRREVKSFGVTLARDEALFERVVRTQEITLEDYNALLRTASPAEEVRGFEASSRAEMDIRVQTAKREYVGGVLKEPTFTMMVLTGSYDGPTGCLIPAAVYFKPTGTTTKEDALWVARKSFSRLRGQYLGCDTTGFK
jgi:hypothetical protein